LDATSTTLDRARGVLRGMAQRAATNKLVTFGVIFMEVVAIGVIVYFKYIKK
jgi:hypothetical protein